MHDAPSGAALLDIARQTLLDDIAPDLRGDARYKVLMIANAMGIVAREIEQAGRWAQAQRNVLESVEMQNTDEAAATATRLVTSIRAGAHDADGALYDALLTATDVAAGIWKPAKTAVATAVSTG